VLALVAGAALGTPRLGRCAGIAASPDEVALLALANEARAKSGLTPYVWNAALGDAALAHSVDMATHGCFDHDSCNGEVWSKRITRYYSGWTALAENIGGGGTARTMHDAWMSSSGHRANILGPYVDFGAGMALNAQKSSFATEDFGRRGIAPAFPIIPAAAVVPRVGYATDVRELLLNYFDAAGAPKAVRALVDGSCVPLTKEVGSATNATYRATATFPTAGCVPVVFEVIRTNGARVRWPANEAIVVGTGTGSLSCPQWTTDVPTQDCGGGVAVPTPTPSAAPRPTPSPAGSTALDGVHVTIKPSASDASTGLVQIRATLPAMSGFDPSSGPLSLHLSYGQGASWTRSVPTCGTTPCLVPNLRATVYRWTNRAGATLNLTLGQNGRWRLRYTGRGEPLGTLASGSVQLSVTGGGHVFLGAVDGSLSARGIAAN
jgi:hypothetical protein